MSGFGKRELEQALRLALSAWLAFAVASAFGIHHAFWASMPIWVIPQPWRGVVFERALWRIVGTVVGGVIGLTILMVSPSPWAAAIAMALALALGAALTHLWQGTKSYVPLMSAITVGVVVIPALLSPAAGMDLALDRLLCTLIGGVSVAVIVGLSTPKAQSGNFYDEVLAFAEASRNWALGRIDGKAVRDRALLLHHAAELETRARVMAAGSVSGYRRMATVDMVIAAALGLLEASDTLAARAGEERSMARRLLSQGNDTQVTPPRHGPLSRFADAKAALDECCQALEANATLSPDDTDIRLRPPRNTRRGAEAAMMAFAVSLAGSAVTILTGSRAAELMAFAVAIFALILGSMPLPHTMAPSLAGGALAGALFGAIYRIGVQPHVVDWVSLVLTILPFIGIGALARMHPKAGPYALHANMCFMLASQAGEIPIAPDAVVIDSLAMATGTIVMVTAYLFMPRPGKHLIAKTTERIWRDIELLSDHTPLSHRRWNAIVGRRIMTLAIELDKAGETIPQDVFALADLGHALNDLRLLAMEEGNLADFDRLLAGNLKSKKFESEGQPSFTCEPSPAFDRFLIMWKAAKATCLRKAAR